MKRYLAAGIARVHWSVQAMRERIASPICCVSCLAGLAIALLASDRAAVAEDADASSIVCAKREVLLMILVEAHGASPNVASEILAAERLALFEVRTACDNGRSGDAMVVYDRLIEKLTTSLTQKEPSTQGEK